jgi:4,5-dihydroxyphthalate decarboxylase
VTQIQLAARNWDHVLPIALGDLPRFRDYRLERREITPDLWSEPELNGGETSLSRYIRARAARDFSVTALPVFIMRGFRHRCIITRKDSPLETAADLRGKRIGVTGWADTGNTWTRAVLRRENVEVADAEWRVGRLTASHPVQDRIGNIAVPENVRTCDNEEPMVEMLLRGVLDAVMTPFMPPGFNDSNSPFRTLFRNTRESEAQYYAETGYIPGIHVLAVQSHLLVDRPARAQELVDLFEDSRLLSD